MAAAMDELENLFRCHRKSLTWKIFRMVSCRETADDLVSEAYARMAGVIHGRSVAHASTFLYQTAHNLAIDHLRREQTRRRFLDCDNAEKSSLEVASPEASPETVIVDRQRLKRLTQTLSGLPKRARKALLLNRVEGLTYPEIAERLGVSESTVYKDIRLALSHCLDAAADD